jgi:hypothetical protein
MHIMRGSNQRHSLSRRDGTFVWWGAFPFSGFWCTATAARGHKFIDTATLPGPRAVQCSQTAIRNGPVHVRMRGKFHLQGACLYRARWVAASLRCCGAATHAPCRGKCPCHGSSQASAQLLSWSCLSNQHAEKVGCRKSRRPRCSMKAVKAKQSARPGAGLLYPQGNMALQLPGM